ncbi:UNVERIFIED_CONTAM: hypothetical protein Slati_4425000 [Sesamum latifolium]|uniref:ATP-dependent DNA helicase n=1 Tax=Sesamum latifolium TaxID=2727402 RepID=A0AAW2SQA6_9LAMI
MDEAAMEHRNVFEIVNKAFKDIIGYTNPNAIQKLFGGKAVVFGGDFRQIFPLVVRGGRKDIVASSVNVSKIIQQDSKVLELTTNMRLHHSSLDPTEVETMRKFGIPNHEIELKEGSHVDERHFIHGIEMSPAESKWPSTFRRRQLPVKVCFAMTINKVSRVTSPHGLKLLINDNKNMLSPEKDGWKIKVKVTKMWYAINYNNGDLFSLDMILLDEHDDHIHVSIHKNQVAKYRRQMHE